ncbi:MAG: prefoldin subunit alpha [Candidatus Nanoarchaeia archaeon]|nr:prefoldin subunit alpha [Candidatus Nanoarchaeia archaeon]MDD5587711.1 prefoldin subunit alpha [Candidatus Nanoarchaeia archaeon]
MSDQEQILQQKYIELQMLDQQIKQVQQQHSILQQQVEELMRLDIDLDDLTKVKENSKAFFPLSAGVFVEGSINNTKELLINVGADVSVKKTIPEAKSLIQEQIKELQEALMNIDNNLKFADLKAHELQEEIIQLDCKMHHDHKKGHKY